MFIITVMSVCLIRQVALIDKIDAFIESFKLRLDLKIIYKGFFKSFVALYADRRCSEHHFVENRIENFPSI